MSQQFLIFLCAEAVFLVVVIFLFLKVYKIEKKLRMFFAGAKGKDLEDVLIEQLRKTKNIQKEIEELKNKHAVVEKMAKAGIQKLGVVRYNAFGESGGDQSFAIAMLDASDNGVVISSLFGRGGFRAYAKPIEQGQSKYQLTEEEKKALKKAKE